MVQGTSGEAPRRGRRMRRRTLLGAGAAVALALPASGLVYLRLQDNPLPRIADPRPVLAGGWLLDARDPGVPE